jgi:CBS domain-containing protein
MQLDDPLICTPDLEEAIDRHPLIVEPDTDLTEAIFLMSQTRGNSCLLSTVSLSPDSNFSESRSSCVLVMHETQLLGILTERDIVKMIARGISLENVKIAQVMTQPVITLPEAVFQNIFAALFLFRRYQIRHLAVVDDRDRVVGVISPESIRQILRPANLLKLRRVSEVMTTNVIQAPLTASVLSLAQLMSQHRVSCVAIVDTDIWHNPPSVFLPVGIVTERDLVQFQALGLNLSKTQAQTVMSTPLFLLSPEDSLWTALQQMQKRRVQRSIVSWNWGQGLGIVTQTNILRVFDTIEMYGVIQTLQRTIEQLEEKQNLQNQNSQIEETRSQRSVKENELNASEFDTSFQENVENLLTKIKLRLDNLASNVDLPDDLRQQNINYALSDLDKIRHLIVTKNIVKYNN